MDKGKPITKEDERLTIDWLNDKVSLYNLSHHVLKSKNYNRGYTFVSRVLKSLYKEGRIKIK